jgi:hypothetical protein
MSGTVKINEQNGGNSVEKQVTNLLGRSHGG